MSKNITDLTLKIGTVKYAKSKLTYVNITKDLIYISWPTGRTYFKITGDYKKIIKNIEMDNDKNKIKFTWKGPWGTSEFGTGKTKQAEKNFVFVFENASDYKKLKKKLVG